MPKTIKPTMNIKDNQNILSKCCSAEVIVSGGGYDGEDICPIIDTCSKCGEVCKTKGRVGRPIKLPF
jgi:hypothetical protein